MEIDFRRTFSRVVWIAAFTLAVSKAGASWNPYEFVTRVLNSGKSAVAIELVRFSSGQSIVLAPLHILPINVKSPAREPVGFALQTYRANAARGGSFDEIALLEKSAIRRPKSEIADARFGTSFFRSKSGFALILQTTIPLEQTGTRWPEILQPRSNSILQRMSLGEALPNEKVAVAATFGSGDSATLKEYVGRILPDKDANKLIASAVTKNFSHFELYSPEIDLVVEVGRGSWPPSSAIFNIEGELVGLGIALIKLGDRTYYRAIKSSHIMRQASTATAKDEVTRALLDELTHALGGLKPVVSLQLCETAYLM